jgi:hypothetical protein
VNFGAGREVEQREVGPPMEGAGGQPPERLQSGRLRRSVIDLIGPRERWAALGDGADGAADFHTGGVRQVGEGHARVLSPRVKSAVVAQHDAVPLGQAEFEIRRMHAARHPGGRRLARMRALPASEIDQAAMAFEQRLRLPVPLLMTHPSPSDTAPWTRTGRAPVPLGRKDVGGRAHARGDLAVPRRRGMPGSGMLAAQRRHRPA